MKALKIVVLGGSGFVGKRLVTRLHDDGHTITVLSRNREQNRELSVLPRVMVQNADVHDPDQLMRWLDGADAVVNLVGILNETGNDGSGFEKAHVQLLISLIAACEACGVRRILQMSSLRAGEGHSHYLRSRGDAEALLRNSDLAWTLFRPSVIFGPGDGLFFRFASLLSVTPVLPLARADARFAPVYVDDVTEAFARALAHPHSIHHCYELFGPDTISLAEIVRWTAALREQRRWVIALPDVLGRIQARVGEWLPGKPISRDNFRSLQLDSVGSHDGLAALGIIATPMAIIVPAMLRRDPHQAELDALRALGAPPKLDAPRQLDS